MNFKPSVIFASSLVLSFTTGYTHAVSADTLEPQRSPKIYVCQSDANGFDTNNFFYDNGEEVVVFDTQFTPEIAEKSVAFLRTKTTHPISTVVITHPNPDKFNGMSVFQKLGAKVIASSKTAGKMPEVAKYKKGYFVSIGMFTEDSYPKLSQVDVEFEKTYDLRLHNGEIITLRELSEPGVSSNQTIAFIPKANALIVGDLIHNGVHAWLEGGIVNGKPAPTLKGWIHDLKEIKSIFRGDPELMVYGGRGEPAPLRLAISNQISYLKTADRLVSQYIAQLGDKKSELSGNQAGSHYKIIQSLFEKTFPTYKLGYLIQYGVYGLVNSKVDALKH